MGYKAYSDSYLMSLTKAEIIELLRVAEHNFFATEEALNNSAKTGMEIAEKYDEAKRLLKAAVEDINFYVDCYESHCDECCCSQDNHCHWKHEAKALKLIGEDGENNA